MAKVATFEKRVRIAIDWAVDLFFDRDVAQLKLIKRDVEKEYKVIDDVDDVW